MDEDFEKIRRGNLTLYIRRQFLDTNFGRALLSGEEKLRERYNLETVPASEFTRIYRFAVDVEGVEREVYLKEFFHRRVRDFIKDILRGSRIKRVLDAELMLAKDHFDVPETLAIGEYRDRFFTTRSFSATFGIEGAKSFFQYLCEFRERLAQEQLSDWREMIRAFGRTIGRMHADNIFHGDLRLNNVLLRREGGKCRFFFLDNERTRKFNRIPSRCRVKNLVQANMTPAGIVSKTDRMRFFREYLAETAADREQGKTLAAAVLKKTANRIGRRERNFTNLRDAIRTGDGHTLIKAGDYRAEFDRDFCRAELLADFIDNLERLIRAGRILREDRNCIVSSIRWNSRELIVKQYVPKGFIHSLLQTTGESPAKRDWLNGHRVKAPKTAANKPLAYIERLKSGLVWKSYFVTEYAEGQATRHNQPIVFGDNRRE